MVVGWLTRQGRECMISPSLLSPSAAAPSLANVCRALREPSFDAPDAVFDLVWWVSVKPHVPLLFILTYEVCVVFGSLSAGPPAGPASRAQILGWAGVAALFFRDRHGLTGL